MNITLVAATESNRSFFRKVHHESYRESIEAMFGWDEALQDRFADTDFDNRNIHIIHLDEQPCGVLGRVDTDNETELGPLYLLDVYQGRGLGTDIVKRFIREAEAKNKLLMLKTLKSNLRAQSFYERLGFIVTEETDKYWFMEYRP